MDQEEDVKGTLNNYEVELNKTKVKLEELNKFKNEVDISNIKNLKQSLVEKRDKLYS